MSMHDLQKKSRHLTCTIAAEQLHDIVHEHLMRLAKFKRTLQGNQEDEFAQVPPFRTSMMKG